MALLPEVLHKVQGSSDLPKNTIHTLCPPICCVVRPALECPGPKAPCDCPCHKCVGLPGAGTLHGHAFFRSPEVLAWVLPPGSRCDWTVFNQNLRNASVPAFKTFKETLLSSLKDLSGSLPDSRRHTTENIARRIADLCETNYKLHAASFPKHVYTHTSKNRHVNCPLV